ncbi:MAG: DNA alkylation repair protein [Bacteroidetes bacterium]|nr:DNA alkylation repair protein [Bacteroidota bacterium]
MKFPLLEYGACRLYETIPEKEQLSICDQIAERNTLGGNVILGIILQKRLENHFAESFEKAATYIEHGAEWYVTDIIGERVFGVALLTHFTKAIPELKKLSHHKSNWVVRSIGPGAHYAIKKGLPEQHVKQLFELLLSLKKTTDFHVKTGIGWAAKTTAKFHPAIIQLFAAEIESAGPWFRTKVRIGLERHAYVKTRRSKNNTE